MPPATSGQRDKLVTIQQRPVVDPIDGNGYPVDDPWTLLTAVWMRKTDVKGLSQGEQFAASQLSAAFDTEWEMPYVSTMDPESVDVPKLRRLLYRGRTYDITRASLLQRTEGRAITMTTLGSSQVPS